MKFYAKVLCAVFVACIAGFVAQPASSFVVGDYLELNANDIGSDQEAGEGDLYGFCLDTDGHWLAVGSKSASVYLDDGTEVESGVVYVYRRDFKNDGWQFVQKLVPEVGASDIALEFGESVAVSRNKILVGARSMPNSKGQASGTAYLYVYRGKKRGWTLETKVEPADGLNGDEFGRAVALGPNRIIVGARFASNDNDVKTGAVYVYKKRGHRWLLEEKLTDSNGVQNDQFGRAISFDANDFQYLAVGSRKASDGEGDQGKVLVYKVNGKKWNLFQELEAEDGGAADYFGQSVALAGDLLVVGARDSVGIDANGKTNPVGAAYIYNLDEESGSWTLAQKLMPEHGTKKGQFGFAVDFDPQSKSTLAVGARRMMNDADVETGLVYLYSRDEDSGVWFQDDVVVPDGMNDEAEFGQSVTVDPIEGEWVIAGADQATVTVIIDGEEQDIANTGAAYYLRADKLEEVED